MRALADDVADDLRLLRAFVEVAQQRARGVVHGFHVPFAVVGGKFLLPSVPVLAHAGRLQVVVQEADGVHTDKEVTHHATIV